MNKNYTRKQLEKLQGKVVCILGEETDDWRLGRYQRFLNNYIYDIDEHKTNLVLTENIIKKEGVFIDHLWVNYSLRQKGKFDTQLPYFFGVVGEYERADGSKDYGILPIEQDEEPFIFLKITILPLLKQINHELELGKLGLGLKSLRNELGALCRMSSNVFLFKDCEHDIDKCLERLNEFLMYSIFYLKELFSRYRLGNIESEKLEEWVEELSEEVSIEELSQIVQATKLYINVKQFYLYFKKLDKQANKYFKKRSRKKSIAKILNLPQIKSNKSNKGFKVS